MNDNEMEKIKKIFTEVMGLSLIPEDFLDLKMSDIEEWDSLANMNLLMEIESVYNIRFSIDEMTKLNSIADIIKTVSEKVI
tara:strand:+ start:1164 stop:1406 length:243 start_codon:yes stop_codon:yes gene_type:complete